MCHAGTMSSPKKYNSEFTKLNFCWRAKKINTDIDMSEQTTALIQHSKCRPGGQFNHRNREEEISQRLEGSKALVVR